MKIRIALSVLVVLMVSVVFTQSVMAKEDLEASWSKGLRLNSEDKDFKFKIGGRIMADFAFFDVDADSGTPLDGLMDGNEFRRARLYFAGTIYDNIDFKAQYDFAGGDADFKDVYIKYNLLPIGIKVGHFKEPFGLEEITSSKYITFMERSTPTEAFSPSRNTGVGVGSTALDNQLTWAVGAFRESDGFGDGEGSNYHWTGRVTATPWSNEDQSNLLHVGGSVSYRDVDGQRYRSRPESHLAPRVVDTGEFGVDSALICGLEAAVVLGPLSFQGEYMLANTDSDDGSDPDLSGYYAFVSWFVTGDMRPYKSSAGAFSRVSPDANAGDGSGAIELAARYSSLDLSDGTVDGGEVDDVTLGVNWYLNPNARIMVNYVNSDADENGEVDVFQTRFQVDF